MRQDSADESRVDFRPPSRFDAHTFLEHIALVMEEKAADDFYQSGNVGWKALQRGHVRAGVGDRCVPAIKDKRIEVGLRSFHSEYVLCASG